MGVSRTPPLTEEVLTRGRRVKLPPPDVVGGGLARMHLLSVEVSRGGARDKTLCDCFWNKGADLPRGVTQRAVFFRGCEWVEDGLACGHAVFCLVSPSIADWIHGPIFGHLL